MADISKIKLANGTTVNIKDATGRSNISTLLGTHALAAIGAAGWLGVDNSIADGGTGVATSGTIKSYVDSQVGSINKFDVVVAASLPTASADTMYKIYLIPDEKGSSTNVKIEYITIRSGSEGSYTYAWEQIGSTATDLDGYVKKTVTIAGVDIQDNITADELKTALSLGNLAYADTASGSGSVSTIDSITMNPITLSTTATISSTATNASLTKADYTPAGTVAAAETDGSFSALTSATFSADESGVQITGTVSKPDITVTPSTQSVLKSVKTDAVAPSFTQGSKASMTAQSKSDFATEGVVASIGTGDDAETLIFTTAGTSQAVTDRGTFTPNGDDSWSAGSAAEFDTETVLTGASAALSANPTFTGGKYKVSTNADTALKNVVFSGTKVTDALVTAVSYDKAGGSADIEATATPTVKTYTRTDKTVSVTSSPVAKS